MKADKPQAQTVALGLLSLALLGACQMTDTISGPAILESADAASLASLKAVLADVTGKASIELGPGDLTKTSRLTVLPPPLAPGETRSTAMPKRFELILEGGVCYVREEGSAEQYPLEGVMCRPQA